jgi:hypothetical protein
VWSEREREENHTINKNKWWILRHRKYILCRVYLYTYTYLIVVQVLNNNRDKIGGGCEVDFLFFSLTLMMKREEQHPLWSRTWLRIRFKKIHLLLLFLFPRKGSSDRCDTVLGIHLGSLILLWVDIRYPALNYPWDPRSEPGIIRSTNRSLKRSLDLP